LSKRHSGDDIACSVGKAEFPQTNLLVELAAFDEKSKGKGCVRNTFLCSYVWFEKNSNVYNFRVFASVCFNSKTNIICEKKG